MYSNINNNLILFMLSFCIMGTDINRLALPISNINCTYYIFFIKILDFVLHFTGHDIVFSIYKLMSHISIHQ